MVTIPYIFIRFVLYNNIKCIKIKQRPEHQARIERYKEDTIMAYVISDDCVACGSCAAVCPGEAISEGDGKFEIDADKCLDCGSCEAECPVGAISAE